MPKSARRTVAVVGNCQSRGIADSLAAMYPTFSVRPGFSQEIRSGVVNLDEMVANTDTPGGPDLHEQAGPRGGGPAGGLASGHHHPHGLLHRLPPRLRSMRRPARPRLDFPLGSPNSAIALHCWKSGLGLPTLVALFQRLGLQAAGLFRPRRAGQGRLPGPGLVAGLRHARRGGRLAGLGHTACTAPTTPNRSSWPAWPARPPRGWARRPTPHYPENLIVDGLSTSLAWPVYPEIARALGVPGEYVFKPTHGKRAYGDPVPVYTCRNSSRSPDEAYAKYDRAEVTCTRLEEPPLRADAGRALRARPPRAASPATPIAACPDHPVLAEGRRRRRAEGLRSRRQRADPDRGRHQDRHGRQLLRPAHRPRPGAERLHLLRGRGRRDPVGRRGQGAAVRRVLGPLRQCLHRGPDAAAVRPRQRRLHAGRRRLAALGRPLCRRLPAAGRAGRLRDAGRGCARPARSTSPPSAKCGRPWTSSSSPWA